MKYQFLFDRKSILVLMAASVLAAALLFAGGLLVGLAVHLPPLPVNLVRQPALPTAKPAAAAAATTAAAPAAAGPATAQSTPAAANGAAAPVATPTAANAAASEAAACGLPVAASTPAGAEAFAIQVGAFAESSDASRLAAQLQSRGCNAAVLQLVDPNHRAWNVVRIGPFDSLQDAVQAADQLQRAQGMLALVRPAGSF